MQIPRPRDPEIQIQTFSLKRKLEFCQLQAPRSFPCCWSTKHRLRNGFTVLQTKSRVGGEFFEMPPPRAGHSQNTEQLPSKTKVQTPQNFEQRSTREGSHIDKMCIFQLTSRAPRLFPPRLTFPLECCCCFFNSDFHDAHQNSSPRSKSLSSYSLRITKIS